MGFNTGSGLGVCTSDAGTDRKRSPIAARVLIASAGLWVAGCGYGGDPGGSSGGGGEDPQISVEQGSTIGVFEVEVPDMDSFLLRGTLPMPAGFFLDDGGPEPFGVVDSDGEAYGAQAEVTAWYPNAEEDGASVVEVIARVNRGSLEVGSRALFQVVLADHAAQPNPGAPGIEDLQDGPLNVPASVKSLLGGDTNLEIASYDCFGNQYLTYPLNGAGDETLLRYGEHTAELRLFQRLAANPPVAGPQGTLPHGLGMHCYFSTFNSEEVVGLDLRVTNADSGNDESTFIDDPLDKVYFQNLQLIVPNGWVVVQDYEDPFFRPGFSSGGKTVFPIVGALDGGKMHVIPWGGQFHRRLAITKPGNEARARALLRGAGLGFARAGIDPTEGHHWFSWWNPLTSRYFPQSHFLPQLGHVGFSAVVNGLMSERDALKGYLENGSSAGGYPVEVGNLGWAHPYGVAYGGMTGGAEVHIIEGVETMWAAEVAGYQKFRMLHRMHTDRQHNVMYNLDGYHTSVDDWIETSGAGPHVPFSHFVEPFLDATDAFGLWKAPTFQIDYVQANGLQPPYESQLLSFDPHDFQHLVRYTRAAKTLAYMANDSLAQDDLLAQAENFRLSYHSYYNSSGGYTQVTGLRWDMDFVAENPAKGFEIGRGEAWGLDCTNAAYATADAAWRAERRPWYDLLAQTLVDGQGACNGFLMAIKADKILDGKYRGRQAYEQAILDNALLGMLETVYRGEDPAFEALLEDVLAESLFAMISEMSWGPGQHAPWMQAAVGPADVAQPIWCTAGMQPGDAITPGAYDTFQNWNEFAYGHVLTGAQAFLDKAEIQAGGGPDVLGTVESWGLDNIENRAGLLAYLQFLNGDL